VQQWVHDLDKFAAIPGKKQDDTIGRRKRDNKELAGAPPSAHVKRPRRKAFLLEAFVLRRSMPWADTMRAGLVFVAFGKSLAAFEAQLKPHGGRRGRNGRRDVCVYAPGDGCSFLVSAGEERAD